MSGRQNLWAWAGAAAMAIGAGWACAWAEPPKRAERSREDQPSSLPATSGGGNYAAEYASYAVAADHPLASAAGAEILKAGGNAVDAAVATSFALSVVRPFSCGIGGGGFMVIAMPGAGKAGGSPEVVLAINYREVSPRAAGAGYFEGLEDPDASTRGGKACAVPGTVAGLLHALERYGTMDRARVMAPALRLAREGFVADAAYAAAARSVIAKFEEHPEWRARFAFTWERFLRSGRVAVGDVVKLPEQAVVLERIAAEGRDGFYKGETAAVMVAAVRGAGGELTLDDLAGYRVVECAPLRAGFDGRVLLTMPPPSSGGLAMAQVFGLLERKRREGVAGADNPASYTHLLVEGFKHAFADRAEFLADPAFVEVPVERLLSGPYLDSVAARMSIGKTASPEFYGTVKPLPEDGGTSHICVVDGRGGAVACTETINLYFGSLVSSPALGFCLNDEMDDFTTRAGVANAYGLRQSEKNLPAPGKRPLSSMSPTIVLGKDGRVEAVAGGSGGPRIITATAQVLLNALVRGDTTGAAVSRARVHHQWVPNVLEVEEGFDEVHAGLEVEMWMRKLGHRVKRATEGAAVQLIKRKGEGWEAACDPRKGGQPAGE